MSELLSVAEMYRADVAAAGIASLELMENAGRAVARELLARFGARPTAVLCGPGNNGGDGFVSARHLAAAGAPVRLGLLGARAALKGDAAVMAGRWPGDTEPLDPEILDGVALVVDALFGAGLTRAVDGAARRVLQEAGRRRLPSIAVDVPSGVDGDSGEVKGYALPAALTVSFFRAKPGHYLHPGRGLCGELRIAEIGIPASVLDDIRPATRLNGPPLWRAEFPWPEVAAHKYSRGHALVRSGGRGRSGAARLAARAALRVGAGLVTVLAPSEAMAECASQLTAIMLEEFADAAGFARALADGRRNAVLVGPGSGVNERTRAAVLAALASGKRAVLDADALTSFAEQPSTLFAAIAGEVLLTPHEGEFRRLFPGIEGAKLARARAAARTSGATVLLKGPDTVVAAPDGFAAINHNAPPELATAGSGDVLAGIATGLLAQGMPAFASALAAAWLHGEAGQACGPGLIAEDLSEALPAVLRRLKQGTSG